MASHRGKGVEAKLQEILENLSAVAQNLSHPLFKTRPETTVGLILVTSAKGMCGNFNSILIRRAEAFIKERPEGSVRLI